MTGEKVLIIDDSEELRALLETILPYGGYKAVGVGSGQEGLDLVPHLEPDVILIDLELPDTTGLKLLEELDRLGFAIPTIMMTGYGSEGSAARALRLGVRDYLIKPFTTEEVLSSIERALSEVRLRRETEQQAVILNDYVRRFQVISAVGQSMIKGLDLDQVLERIVDAAVVATRADMGSLLLLDDDLERLHVVAARGCMDGEADSCSSTASDERLHPVLQAGVAVRLYSEAGRTIELQTGDTVQAVCQVPLRIESQICGILVTGRRGKRTAFGKRDEQTLMILADYAALAVERDRQAIILSAVHAQTADC